MKTCTTCKTPYKPYKKTQKFCSNACRYKYHDKRRKPNQREVLVRFLKYLSEEIPDIDYDVVWIDEFYKSIK